MSAGLVRRLLLVVAVTVVVAATVTVVVIASPGVAWAVSNRPGVGAQVATGRVAARPTAEQQQQRQAAQQQAVGQAAERVAMQAGQQGAGAGHASLASVRLGHPARLVIVHAGSIDSVAAGRVVQRVVRNGRALSLAGLDAAIPSSWLTIAGDTARLNAAVVLSPSTLLDVEGVHTLQLAGGTEAAAAAFLDTGSGRIGCAGLRSPRSTRRVGDRSQRARRADPTSRSPAGAGWTPPMPRSATWAARRSETTAASRRSGSPGAPPAP